MRFDPIQPQAFILEVQRRIIMSSFPLSGLTLTEWARTSGLDPKQLSKMLNGHWRVREAYAAALNELVAKTHPVLPHPSPLIRPTEIKRPTGPGINQAESYSIAVSTFQLHGSSIKALSTEWKQLNRIHAAIEARIGDTTFSVDELACDAGISRRSMERLLKKVGITPLRLIRRLRMERAAALLAEGHLSVKEVAIAVSYKHPGQFAAVFRREYDVAPSEYLTLNVSGKET